MAFPYHENPAHDREPATAPYNFVSLPRAVMLASADPTVGDPPPWQAHDRWLPRSHSGWIDISITALTPLFIRGPRRRDANGAWDQREARLRSEPWMDPDGRPVIPGSSLRGMLRTLVEILGFAKIQPVSDDRLFFRSMADDAIAKAYRDRVSPRNRKPEAGFLRRRSHEWVVEPCAMLRVSHRWLRQVGLDYPAQPEPDYFPPWEGPCLQQQPCWVQRHADGRQVSRFSLGEALPRGDGWVKGTLVLTGSAPKKKAEFVFLAGPATEQVTVPDEVWTLFHDDDQLTQWQEEAFPVGKPKDAKRQAPGHLRDGEPVFFIRDGDKVRFLGRAQMFRIAYDRTVADIVPPKLRPPELDEAELDVAEALFGRVVKGQPAVKGRVRVEDAVAVGDRGDWLEDELVPPILGSPRPTTVAHYLTQTERASRDKKALNTYVESDATTVRGHKLYWHHWQEERLATLREQGERYEFGEQHTRIRPVRAGVVFQGRVRFDNLTNRELGALLAALQLPSSCAHKLGMAKPIGLGSVSIEPTLHLVDRARRYRSWTDSGELGETEIQEHEQRCTQAFESAVLDHAQGHGEPLLAQRRGLAQIARLDALFLLLHWDDQPPLTKVAYLDLEEFKDRRILPTPHRVRDQPEPAWRGPTPSSAPGPTSGSAGVVPAAVPVARSTVRCRLLEKTTKKGGALFELPDGREGHLHPQSAKPPGLTHGQEIDLEVFADATPGEQVTLRWVDPESPPPVAKKKQAGPKKPKRGRR